MLKFDLISVPVFNRNVWDFCNSKRYFLSIIILSHQKPEYLDNAIWSILNQKISCGYEIIVVDDGSNNGIEEVILKYGSLFQEKKLKYIKICTRLGYYKPLLVGAAAADGEVLYIHHDDVIFDTDIYIETLMQNLDAETIAVFPKGFKYVDANFSDFGFDWKKEPEKMQSLRSHLYQDCPWFISGCIKREDLRKHTLNNRPYPEGSGEGFLENSLRKTGKKFKFIEGLIAYHVKHTTAFFGEGVPYYWWGNVKEPA